MLLRFCLCHTDIVGTYSRRGCSGFSLCLFRTLRVGEKPEAQCISHCNCFTSSISPVCGSNGVTYLSACLAGCTRTEKPRTASNVSQVFTLTRSCDGNQWQLSSDFTMKKTPDDANFSLNFLKCCRYFDIKVKKVSVFHSSVVSWAIKWCCGCYHIRCRLQISVFYIQITCRENFSQLSSKKYHYYCCGFKVQI